MLVTVKTPTASAVRQDPKEPERKFKFCIRMSPNNINVNILLPYEFLRKYVTHTYVLTYFKSVGRFAAIAYFFKYFKHAER